MKLGMGMEQMPITKCYLFIYLFVRLFSEAAIKSFSSVYASVAMGKFRRCVGYFIIPHKCS